MATAVTRTRLAPLAAGLLAVALAAGTVPPPATAGTANGTAVAASPASAAASATGRSARKQRQPYLVSATPQALNWAIRRTESLQRWAKIRAVQPCLRLQYRGRATDICATTRSRVRVRHSRYAAAYAVAVQWQKERRQFRVQIDRTDLMLHPGNPRVIPTCSAPGCGARWDPPRPKGRVPVTARVLQSCSAGTGKVRAASGAGKRVALTFDDGPGGQTEAVLRTLRDMDVPGTFFIVGSMTGGRTELLQRMYSEGHALGTHTYGHADLARLSDADGTEEILSGSRAIAAATGFRTCLFRAPYGTEDSRVIALAGRLGLLTVGWSVDPGDWRRPGAAAIVGNVMANTRPGSVILMHDGGGSDAGTPTALGTIISRLRDKGYRFVTVPELFDLPRTYR